MDGEPDARDGLAEQVEVVVADSVVAVAADGDAAVAA